MHARLLTPILLVTAMVGSVPAQAPTTVPSSIDACAASAGALADEPFVMATAPLAGALVKSGFTVQGCSRTFESRFAWTLTLRGGKVLAKGTATGGGVDGPRPFSFTVTATVAKPTLAYLEISEPRMSGDGPPPSRAVVPVVVTP